MQIVGIILVRDEDLHIEQVMTNVVGFCDRLIVADHQSKDGTAGIVAAFAERFKHVDYCPISDPRESHDLIKGYAGTPTWIFGVDGDEIYDPVGLAKFRGKLEDGVYDDSWAVFGNVLNCTELHVAAQTAEGYLAPPCRSMTKLYNFSMISSWEGDYTQRLHDGTIVFKDGFSAKARCNIHKDVVWEESFFRCLHLCWMTRSSLEGTRCGPSAGRRNVTELRNRGCWDRLRGLIFRGSGAPASNWKKSKYGRGDLATKGIASFFV